MRRVLLLFILRAINLQRLSLLQVEAASEKVEVLLGCYKPDQILGMDAKAFYEDMLASVGKLLSADGHIIDRKGNK